MANYAKRDARALWSRSLSEGREERQRARAEAIIRCHCGEIAVIGYYPGDGLRPNRFFCEAHKDTMDELFGKGGR